MARWLSWLERRPVTAEVAGSSPAGVVCNTGYGIIAQLGEHLPYKQRVIVSILLRAEAEWQRKERIFSSGESVQGYHPDKAE